MKLRIVGLSMLMTLGVVASVAQDTFSDEELNKYATVMKWAEGEKGKMGKAMAAEVKADEALSASAFNKLKKAAKAGDVNSTDATEEEVASYVRIKENSDMEVAEFKTVYSERVKSDMGANLYNRLRKALKTDTELKARYQAIYDGLDSDEMEEGEESEDKAG